MTIYAAKLCASEIAVLPYKINNPGMNFSVDSGDDYAKLISVGAALKKGLDIYPAFQLKKDLRSIGIDPSITITQSNIEILAKSRLIDYIITGSILKTDEGFASKSILYSASSGKVINNSSVKADTLENLAEKEIYSLFMFLPDLTPSNKSAAPVDTVIVLDSSIQTSLELSDLKKKLPELYTVIKTVRPDSAIYFANFPTTSVTIKSIRNLSEFEATLGKITNSGKNTNQSYEESLNRAIVTVPWQKNSSRNIIFISNSSIQKSPVTMQLSTKAQNKKIKISHILLSKIDKSSSIVYYDISVKTGGFLKDVTYHQRLIDGQGNDFHLFYERERLFMSDIIPSEWKNGVLKYTGSNRDTHVKTSSFVSEMDISQKRNLINITSLEKYFRQYGDRPVVEADKVDSNFESILSDHTIKFLNLEKNSPIAKVLLSQFATSIWLDLYNSKDVAIFQNALNTGTSVLTGLTIFPDSKSQYGISFGNIILTQFKYDDIPLSIKTDFKNIITDKNKYINNGFLNPAVWFFDARVERIIILQSEEDIRN